MARSGPEDAAEPPALDPERYAAWFETGLGRLVWQDELAVLRPLLGRVDGLAVLDAGIGEARLSLDLVRQGALVTGVDASPAMLRRAQRHASLANTRLPLVGGRLEALPFRTGSFDLVIAVTVLCLVPAPALAMREMARVLRPGGRLVLGELGRWSPWAARRRLSGLLGNVRWRRARFWTPASLERLVRSHGLEPSGWGAGVFYPPHVQARRLLRPLEKLLSRRHSAVGAAFVAVAAEKREPASG